MSSTATRLISLILLMQKSKNWKVSELASELNVSDRTVHRYMVKLEEMGIPIYSERGPYGGFSLVPGYKLPPLIFTAEEATVLYMGANLVEQLWGQTYRDDVTAVTAKLDNVLPENLRQRVYDAQQSLLIGKLSWRDAQTIDPIVHILRTCIGERLQVRLVYQRYDFAVSERTVDPYALIFNSGQWYLAGYCHLREEMRIFRVDRIQQAKQGDKTFKRPRDFNAKEFFDTSLRYDLRYQVVIHIAPEAAPHVRREHSSWLEFEEQEDGSAVVRFGTGGLDWPVSWVLGFGGLARALEPPELVEFTRQQAQAVLDKHVT
jgi:predicted DNA-binding transcriptional regulator YafY